MSWCAHLTLQGSKKSLFQRWRQKGRQKGASSITFWSHFGVLFRTFGDQNRFFNVFYVFFGDSVPRSIFGSVLEPSGDPLERDLERKS